jgi:hypothetical protein
MFLITHSEFLSLARFVIPEYGPTNRRPVRPSGSVSRLGDHIPRPSSLHPESRLLMAIQFLVRYQTYRVREPLCRAFAMELTFDFPLRVCITISNSLCSSVCRPRRWHTSCTTV